MIQQNMNSIISYTRGTAKFGIGDNYVITCLHLCNRLFQESCTTCAESLNLRPIMDQVSAKWPTEFGTRNICEQLCQNLVGNCPVTWSRSFARASFDLGHQVGQKLGQKVQLEVAKPSCAQVGNCGQAGLGTTGQLAIELILVTIFDQNF